MGPALLNTEEEYGFLKIGQRSLCNSDSYWINGSTNIASGNILNYTTDYITDNSGKYSISIKNVSLFSHA